MEALLEAFQNQLTGQVRELKYIDEDWGQLDYYANFPPVKFPCALIDVQSAEYSDDGALIQEGTLTVTVKLYAMKLTNTSALAPQTQKEEAKKVWRLLKSINQALHGQRFLPAGYAAPIRRTMARIKREDGVYERDTTYTIAFKDTSCLPVRNTITVTPTLSASITRA